MPEQFTLQQTFGQCTAMDTHHREKFPWRVGVDGLGHQLLPRTAFSGDDHRGIGLCHTFDLPENLLHGFALADHIFHVLQGDNLFLQNFILFDQGNLFGGIPDQVRKIIRIERLRDIVECPILQGLNSCIYGGKGRHDNDNGIALQGFDAFQHLQTIHTWHFNICQDNVITFRLKHGECSFCIFCTFNVITILDKPVVEGIPYGFLIVNNQY